jgi:hypothetical protein
VLIGGAVGVLAFGALLGVLVVRFSTPAPADPMAGMLGMPGMGGPAGSAGPPSPGVAPLSGSPEVPSSVLRAAHENLDAGRYEEALAAYRAVMAREPQSVEAITHYGVMLALAGSTDGALAAFERALAIDPSHLHALWDRARTLHELRRDYAAAAGAWERVLEVLPAGPDRERALVQLRDARAQLTTAPPPSAPPSAGSSAGAPPSGPVPSGAHPGQGRHDP